MSNNLKDTTFQIRISKADREEAMRLANEMHHSLGAFIRLLLEEWLRAREEAITMGTEIDYPPKFRYKNDPRRDSVEILQSKAAESREPYAPQRDKKK